MARRDQPPGRTDSEFGAAVVRPRDAYREVPILQRPPWGHWVAEYFFFGGISSGAFTVGSLAALRGGERHRSLARTSYYVAFAAVLPCPICLIADLGKPERFLHMLRIFKPSSPMNLGAWVLVAHSGFVTLAAAAALAREVRLPVIGRALALLPLAALGALGLPTALALGGYTGVLLGTTSIPVWYTSPLLGALFMGSALSSGTAAVALANTLGGRAAPQEQHTLAPLAMVLDVAELALLGGYLATSGPAAAPLLRDARGRQTIAEGALGLAAVALELAGLRDRRRARLLGAAAALATLSGGALLRWSIVHAGHASADDREGTLAAMSPSPGAPGWGR